MWVDADLIGSHYVKGDNNAVVDNRADRVGHADPDTYRVLMHMFLHRRSYVESPANAPLILYTSWVSP